MSFEEELKDWRRKTQEIVFSYLPEEKGTQQKLLEAMNYSMLAGGKRLRPMLMLLAFEAFSDGADPRTVYPFMAAMEMIHTHSLIHDDLPAIDNDEFRRGKKTTHVVYGEGAAILAGDALLNYAYETALQSFTAGADPHRAIKALGILSAKTGINGMIGGQSVDVQTGGRALDAEQLEFIYDLKTAALIEASLMIGAVMGGADEPAVQSMESIGRRIGRAFQIQDDILDETGDQQTIGKPVHSDSRNHKTTYVTLYGAAQASRDAAELTELAVSEMDEMGIRDSFLRELLESLVGRRS